MSAASGPSTLSKSLVVSDLMAPASAVAASSGVGKTCWALADDAASSENGCCNETGSMLATALAQMKLRHRHILARIGICPPAASQSL